MLPCTALFLKRLFLTMAILSHFGFGSPCILGNSLQFENQSEHSSVWRVIYGDDNRYEVAEYPSHYYQHAARSVAALFHKLRLDFKEDHVLVKGKTLLEKGYCLDEPFVNQTPSASCTGFLVRDDWLLTAGHCILTVDECKIYRWVFDYHTDMAGQMQRRISKENVYSCVEILERRMSHGKKIDYTLLRLDRPVKGRSPLPIRTSGSIKLGDPLIMIGHPTGLPAKIADQAQVIKNIHPNFFVSNLDAYHGNSGSPVFNTKTGWVEGILVRGEYDFTVDPAENCKHSAICGEATCQGEDVTRITTIKKLVQQRRVIIP